MTHLTKQRERRILLSIARTAGAQRTHHDLIIILAEGTYPIASPAILRPFL